MPYSQGPDDLNLGEIRLGEPNIGEPRLEVILPRHARRAGLTPRHSFEGTIATACVLGGGGGGPGL